MLVLLLVMLRLLRFSSICCIILGKPTGAATLQQSAIPAKITWVHCCAHVCTDMDIKLCTLITSRNCLQSGTAAGVQ